MDKATTLDQLDRMLICGEFARQQLEVWAASEEAKEIPAEKIQEQWGLFREQMEALRTAVRAVEALDPADKVFDAES